MGKKPRFGSSLSFKLAKDENALEDKLKLFDNPWKWVVLHALRDRIRAIARSMHNHLPRLAYYRD